MRKFKKANKMHLKDRCFLDDIDESKADDDVDSEYLQHYHKIIWNARFKQFFKEGIINKKIELKAESEYHYLYYDDNDKDNTRLGSDTLFTGFKNEKLGIKEQDIPPDFHQLAHTFGGKIIFPKYQYNTINTRRGCSIIHDRIDFTLKYIQDFYASNYEWNKSKKDNLLFNKGVHSKNPEYRKADEDFFKLFKTFENFIKFFFLKNFVRKNKKEKKYKIIDLIRTKNIRTPEFIDDDSSPQLLDTNKDNFEKNYSNSSTDLGRWRINSTKLILKRDKKIDRFIKKCSLQKELKKIDPKYK